LGILNITELTGSSAETTTGKDRDQLNEAHQHPPVIMFPLEEKTSTTKKPTISIPSATTPKSGSSSSLLPTKNNGQEISSAEVSSAEHAFIEQLLGIRTGGGQSQETGGGGTAVTNGQSDSGEQLLQLFGNLFQGQLKNQDQGKQHTNQQNPLSNNHNNNANNDAQTNALLQSLILSSLKPNQQPDLATNLFNLESLLTPPQLSSTGKPQPSSTSRKPLLTTSPGLSDADLKSIFQLLDSQTSKYIKYNFSLKHK
jgi:hypothetical protein